MQVGGREPAAEIHHLLQHVRALGDDLAPAPRARSAPDRRRNRRPRDAPLVVNTIRRSSSTSTTLNLASSPAATGDGGRPGLARVEQVHLALRPALADGDRQPAAVGRQVDARPVRHVAAVAEQLAILGRVVAQPVVVDGAVVLHLAGRHLARRRVARVVEAAPVGRPGDRAGARARDLVAAVAPGRDVAHAQHRFLAAVVGDAVGDQRAVVGREPPVERARAVGAVGVDVDQRLVGAAGAVAHVQHGLVLLAVAARVEIAARGLGPGATARDTGTPTRTDLVELPEPLLQRGAAGDAIERATGRRVLRVGPALDLGRVRILEPAIRVGHVDAVQAFDDVVLARGRGCGRLGGGGHGRRQ